MKKSLVFILACLIVLIVINSCSDSTEPKKQVATPIFSPAGGTYTETQEVTITCQTEGAVIKYTTDGTEPTESSLVYVTPIIVSTNTTLIAKGFKNGWDASQIATAVYTIEEDLPSETVATPTFDPPGGTYDAPQTVTITCTTEGATIRYTTDGTDPNEISPVYSDPIMIDGNTTIKARAYKTGWLESDIAVADYIIQTIADNLVFVEGGSFSPDGGNYLVTLSSYYIGKYEVTVAEYASVMGTNPSYWGYNPDRPVERVSWFNAIEYCNRLSMLEGLTPAYSYSTYGTDPDNWPSVWDTSNANHINVSCNWTANGYRLPTEMEWMFAAMGGNQTQGYFYSGSDNLNEVAWHLNNSSNRTHDVGTKAPNELLTYDMSGNVWELCWDISQENYPSGAYTNPTGPVSGLRRMKRGGCWRSSGYYCTVTYRGIELNATYIDNNLGFRVSRISP
ncbi:MAG: chitobiase/beta-hexosaminidase C-terminal domain-containing protein [Candidatus Cloacimonetes bacterium]|nr:chitobiase/beta-hexosaminidase C-terminal domain-containing protein [Candidatus Cloacimonadota bacterium]